MLGFSQEFLNKSKVTKIWLNFTLSDGTLLEFHEDRVLFNGFNRDSSTTVDGQFTVGAAVTGKLTLHLDNTDDALSPYDFRGATAETWLGGYKPSTVTTNLHPDADIVGADQFTITGMTAEQIALFEVGGMVAFGMTDGSQDVGTAVISAVSTTSGVTTITLEDDVFTSKDAYVSILVGEKVNAGRYYIDEYTYDGSNVTMVGYDDMVKFDVPCNTSSLVWRSGLHPFAIINRACSAVGVTSYNNAYYLPTPITTGDNPPKQWDTMTLHDLISYWAQICGRYAHFVYVPGATSNYQLKFDWYDMSQLTANQYDGGTFDTDTTPYSDGATLDGGSFDPWNTGDAADGGAFGDRSGVHIIGSPYDLTVDTDDVMITGVTVTLDPSDNINADDDTKVYTKTLGNPGYIIQITGNPFIETTEKADLVCAYLYRRINGMRFRPLNASVVENPAMEAGDVAIVTGRNENTYNCFLSHVTYSVNAATQISCDAVSTMQNLKGRYSGAQKTQAMIQMVASDRAVSNAETAMLGILASYTSSRGLYKHEEDDGAGGKIYTYGNAPTLANSDIRWRFSAGSLMVSKDYGQTWNGALTPDGVAVLQQLYAVGINADYIVAGDLTLGGTSKNVDGHFYLKDASGNMMVTMDKNGIYHGKTGISDTTHTGFYLNDDGFIIGDGAATRYVRITPDGTVYVHDNPYYNPGQEEIISPVSSFLVEGVDANGAAARTSIMSEEIETTGDITAGKTIYSPVISNLYGEVIACSYSQVEIKHLGIQGYEDVVSNPYVFIGCVGTSFGVNVWESDRKLKKNINDSTVDALGHVNKIQHRSFELKRNGAKVDNGYIAQEIEDVIPGSVFDVPQPDGTTKKQINEAGIIPYLSKAIQELSAKIDTLETRLAELEGK